MLERKNERGLRPSFQASEAASAVQGGGSREKRVRVRSSRVGRVSGLWWLLRVQLSGERPKKKEPGSRARAWPESRRERADWSEGDFQGDPANEGKEKEGGKERKGRGGKGRLPGRSRQGKATKERTNGQNVLTFPPPSSSSPLSRKKRP